MYSCAGHTGVASHWLGVLCPNSLQRAVNYIHTYIHTFLNNYSTTVTTINFNVQSTFNPTLL